MIKTSSEKGEKKKIPKVERMKRTSTFKLSTCNTKEQKKNRH